MYRAKGFITLAAVVCIAGAGLLGGLTPADAAFGDPACLAKKLTEWGKLRNCQAKANAKLIQAKFGDLVKCQTKFQDKLTKISANATAKGIACRYGSNPAVPTRVGEPGTVTDYDTGLQWEAKVDLGIVVDCPFETCGIHDTEDTHTWTATTGGTIPDGTAFTEFLGMLNLCMDDGNEPPTWVGGFAGHCDWRLPSILELEGIVDWNAPGCGDDTGPCIDQAVFGPTATHSFYWSVISFATGRDLAWGVRNGSVDFDFKDTDFYVRAVRSGL